MISLTERVCTSALVVLSTKESSKMIDVTGMGNRNGQAVKSTKESGVMIRGTEKALTVILMVMSTKETLKMINVTDMASKSMQTAMSTMVSGKMARDTDNAPLSSHWASAT